MDTVGSASMGAIADNGSANMVDRGRRVGVMSDPYATYKQDGHRTASR